MSFVLAITRSKLVFYFYLFVIFVFVCDDSLEILGKKVIETELDAEGSIQVGGS